MTKCNTPGCSTVMKACTLINGKCTKCHLKLLEEQKNKQQQIKR